MNRDKAIIEAIIAQRNDAMGALAICQADLACAKEEIDRLSALAASGPGLSAEAAE